MKSKKTLLFASLALMSFSLVACGNNRSDTPTGDAPTSDTTSQKPNSNTSSGGNKVTYKLTAKTDKVEMKIDESSTITNFYTITKNSGSMTNAEKACTYKAEDPSIIKITNKLMKAINIGTTKVTVTSNKDKTLSCTFTVTVTNVYFDRAYSQVNSEDDFSKELIEDGGVVETKGSTTADLFVKGIDTTAFIAESTFRVNSVASTEKYPKFGIVCSTQDHAAEDTSTNNKMYFFLNAEMPNGESSWNRFGICEVQNGSNWAWNPGVTNETARHKDDLYTTDTPVTYSDEFKLTMVRKNLDFHFFVNDNYAGSCHSYESLFMNGEENLKTMVGFFEFNSDVTFSHYNVNDKEADVDTKIAAIENVHYLTDSEWAAD